MEPNIPNALSNQRTTAITTTAFNIFFMVDCIGMYVLINHRITPTTIRTIIKWTNGIVFLLSCCSLKQKARFSLSLCQYEIIKFKVEGAPRGIPPDK
jgi:hypothetical protein